MSRGDRFGEPVMTRWWPPLVHSDHDPLAEHPARSGRSL